MFIFLIVQKNEPKKGHFFNVFLLHFCGVKPEFNS